MSKDYLSIDISDNRINFVVGKQVDQQIYIKDMFYLEDKNDFYRDGVILDFNEFTTSIKHTLKKHKVKTKNAIISVSPNFVDLKTLEIDRVDDNILIDMVKVELLNQDVMLDDYELQVLIDYEASKDDELTYKIKAFLMSKKFVDDIRKALKVCKLTPIHLDITSNTISKLHTLVLKNNEFSTDYTLTERQEATVMYVDIANINAQVVIMKGNNQELYRSQDNSLFLALFEGREITDTMINDFINSVELINKSYKSKSVGNYIDEIFVYGYNNRTEKALEIKDKMFERFQTNVNQLSNINGIVTGNINDEDDISSYINAITALIRL